MTELNILIYLSAFLFTIGLIIVLSKKHAIPILMGIELMLNAANLNLIGWNASHPSTQDGQMAVLFIILIAVCEASVGIAIIVKAYQHYHTSIPADMHKLSEDH